MASGNADSLETVDEISDLLGKTLSLNDKSEIKKKLSHLECPFTWELPSPDSGAVDMVRRTEMKLQDMRNEDEELLSWKTCVINIMLCHVYVTRGGEVKPSTAAFEKLEECESLLNEDTCKPFFSIEGLQHILLATKCYLLYHSEKYSEMEKVLSEVKSFEDMDHKGRATVYGAQAGMLMEYGYEGAKGSVSYVEKAIELDPDCGEWHFLLGRALGRLRRMEDRTKIPDIRELQALEKACSITQCRAFMVLLAQSYRETSRAVFFEKKNERRTFKPYCDALNKKSLALYRKLIDEAEDNVHTNVRCAQGLLKLPMPYRNLALAKDCILKALAVSPNNTFANHVAGTYYSMVNDDEKAIKHLRISADDGNYGACMDLLSIHHSRDHDFDPVPELEKMFQRFKTMDSYKEDILCLLGAHYYYNKNSFKKALEYWAEVIQENIHSEKLKVFRSRLVNYSQEINISKIILNDITKELNRDKISKEEKQLYEYLLKMYSKHHTGLVKTLPRESRPNDRRYQNVSTKNYYREIGNRSTRFESNVKNSTLKSDIQSTSSQDAPGTSS